MLSQQPLTACLYAAVDIPLDTNRLPARISDSSSLLGVVYLNFSESCNRHHSHVICMPNHLLADFAVTLPSWANEKLPDVSTNSVIYIGEPLMNMTTHKETQTTCCG